MGTTCEWTRSRECMRLGLLEHMERGTIRWGGEKEVVAVTRQTAPTIRPTIPLNTGNCVSAMPGVAGASTTSSPRDF
jgi:hypothetical protein